MAPIYWAHGPCWSWVLLDCRAPITCLRGFSTKLLGWGENGYNSGWVVLKEASLEVRLGGGGRCKEGGWAAEVLEMGQLANGVKVIPDCSPSVSETRVVEMGVLLSVYLGLFSV